MGELDKAPRHNTIANAAGDALVGKMARLAAGGRDGGLDGELGGARGGGAQSLISAASMRPPRPADAYRV